MITREQISASPDLLMRYLTGWNWADHRGDDERRIAAGNARWMQENGSCIHETDQAYNLGLIDRHDGKDRLYANY